MTILITGDTHGDPITRFSYRNCPATSNLTEDDCVIIAGDFGVIWKVQSDRQEHYILKWLDSRPYKTLFVDGNHENFTRLDKFATVAMLGADVGQVSEKVFHLRRGRVYKIQGRQIFCFGGGVSIDKYMRTEGISWWPQEVANWHEMNSAMENLDKVDWRVDYVITHTAPGVCAEILINKHMGLQDKVKDPTTDFLNEILMKCKFRRWFCGHFHIEDKIHGVEFLNTNVVEA